MAIAVAVALAVLLAVYVTRLRRKETRFGWVVMRLLPSFPFSGHTHFAVFFSFRQDSDSKDVNATLKRNVKMAGN